MRCVNFYSIHLYAKITINSNSSFVIVVIVCSCNKMKSNCGHFIYELSIHIPTLTIRYRKQNKNMYTALVNQSPAYTPFTES